MKILLQKFIKYWKFLARIWNNSQNFYYNFCFSSPIITESGLLPPLRLILAALLTTGNRVYKMIVWKQFVVRIIIIIIIIIIILLLLYYYYYSIWNYLYCKGNRLTRQWWLIIATSIMAPKAERLEDWRWVQWAAHTHW